MRRTMPTPVLACPSCHVSLKVPDTSLGRKLRCPRCGNLDGAPVGDAGLAHFKGCTGLRSVSLTGTRVTDLSPLKGMPLKELSCDFKPERDTEILRSLKSLQRINGKPAAEFWKEVDARNP
jgi:hypothetical protein